MYCLQCECISPPFRGGGRRLIWNEGLTWGPYPWHCCPRSIVHHRNFEFVQLRTCCKVAIICPETSLEVMKRFLSVLVLCRTPILLIIDSTQISALEDPFLVRMSFLDLHNMARLTLNGTIHLEPPGNTRKLEGKCCCYQSLEMESLLIILIMFLDAYCLLIAVIMWHMHHAIFGMLIRPKENSSLYQFEGECWNLWCKCDTSLACLAPIWYVWWFSGARSNKFLLLYWTMYLTWTLVDYIW